MQEQGPIAFNSRRMTPAEMNYGVTEQELLAVVWNLQVWRHYLEGASGGVTVIIDHSPNTFFKPNPSSPAVKHGGMRSCNVSILNGNMKKGRLTLHTRCPGIRLS